MTAWLFSDAYLSAEELQYAAARVRRGDRPDPSRALQEQAREAMGAQPLPLTGDALRPLPSSTLLALTAGNLLLTPLTGIAVWAGLREDRPRAARQALYTTLPVLVLLSLAWVAARVIGPLS